MLLQFDATSVYNLVNWDILIKKCEALGFTAKTRQWFRSYLENRIAKVEINGQKSNEIKTESGTPEGGRLSSMLYSIATLDLPYWTSDKLKLVIYADDIFAYYSSPSLEEAIEFMEKEAVKILNFNHANKFAVNPSKTNCIIFPQIIAKEKKLQLKLATRT